MPLRPRRGPASNPAVGISQAQADRLKRAQIADAVAAAAAEQGYAGTAVRRVCARAQSSNKSYYRFFADRHEAFFYARARLLADLGAVLDDACAAHHGADEATRTLACAAALATWVERHPGPARVCFAEAPVAGAVAGAPDRHLHELRAWFERRRDRLAGGSGVRGDELVALIAGTLHGALSAGEVSADAVVVALARILDLHPTPAEVTGAMAVAESSPPPTMPREAACVLDEVGASLHDGRSARAAIGRLRELVVQATVDHDDVTLRAVRDVIGDGLRDGLPPASRATLRGLAELAAAGLSGGPRSVLQLAGRGGPGRGELPAQARRALALIAERPGLNGRELGTMLSINHDAQLSRLLSQLRARGLIRDTGVGRRAWEVTEGGAELLEPARSGR